MKLDSDATFTLIETDNIESGRYYIRFDGEIFDDKKMKFLSYDKIHDFIYLEDINGNLIHYIRKELMLKVFVSSFYGADNTVKINTISGKIYNVKDLELYL